MHAPSLALLLVVLLIAIVWPARAGQESEREPRAASEGTAPEGAVFQLPRLEAARAESGRAYHEFLRVPALSTGLYALPAGAVDRQQPHEEDEIYHVLEGRAVLRIGADDHPVEPGSVAYVRAGVEHRFHSIESDLSVLVVFAAAPAGR